MKRYIFKVKTTGEYIASAPTGFHLCTERTAAHPFTATEAEKFKRTWLKRYSSTPIEQQDWILFPAENKSNGAVTRALNTLKRWEQKMHTSPYAMEKYLEAKDNYQRTLTKHTA